MEWDAGRCRKINVNTMKLEPCSRASMREGFEVNRTPKRNVKVNGKQTSISIEQEFWDAFRSIAASKGINLSDLASEIAAAHGDQPNLSSGIRIFVLNYYWRLADEPSQ